MNVYQFVCMFFSLLVFYGGMWDLIVLIPDHCLSIYFQYLLSKHILDTITFVTTLNIRQLSKFETKTVQNQLLQLCTT